MGEKEKKRSRLPAIEIVITLVFLAGILVMLYPKISDWINARNMSRAVLRYSETVEGLTEEEYNALFAKARAYNLRLKENPNPFSETSRTEGYDDCLDVGDRGIMGYVTIEKIRVRLPFYHGTNEAVLQTAIGHVEGSSLPIGETGDHAVLSAHRGLPTAKLFTDLPDLMPGDRFVVNVLNRRMVYEVDQIKTVLPDEITDLMPVEGKDLVTLMTCTPYGVNTHRLLVRGHRTGDDQAPGTAGRPDGPGAENAGGSLDKYVPAFAAAAAVVFLILLVSGRNNKKRREKQQKESKEGQ